MPSPIMQAIKQICDEKDIPVESVITTIEAALAAAYRKDFGNRLQNLKAKFDPETGDFEIYDVKTVVEDMELPTEEELAAAAGEAKAKKEAPPAAVPAEGEAPAAAEEAPAEEPVKKFNPKTEIMISEARKTLKPDAQIGEEIWTKLEAPAAFGRMAAQSAKQVIIQNIREAERNKLYAEFKEKENELTTGTVQRREGKLVLVDLGRTTAIMPPEEQVAGERYAPGDRLKVFVTAVRLSTRGPEVVVSRTHPEIVRKLFAMEIPEIASGVVLIKSIAREAGSRSKVAVASTQANVDPIGSCIGQRGTRIQTIIGELGGEKIDIIQYDDDPVKFITNSLSPAKIKAMELNHEARVADVSVSEDQLSLAIGKGGQNVRLASKLTGWKINIRGADAAATAETTEEPQPPAAPELTPEEQPEK